jgi:hypothetical protein
MALDPHYITDGPLEEAFLDKDTGLPLAGGFIYFFRDASRITPKTVYQLTGSPPDYTYVALPNPIELSSIGTVQDAGGDNVVIYYYPWLADGLTPDLYYIEVTDSNGVVQFTREAWPNGIIANEIISDSTLPVQNQISNPQFTNVLINYVPGLTPPTTTFTVSGSNQTFAVAPEWNFLASGSGTITVQRIALAGIVQAPTSPPYALDIQVSGGVSPCYLVQRFYRNSGLWTSTASENIFLSTSLTAKNVTFQDTSIQMYYNASSGSNTLISIFNAIVPAASDFITYNGSSGVAIPASDDTNSGSSGYVDIYISLPVNAHVQISSIQVVPTFNAVAAANFSYDEASANRDEALQGSYYLPRVTKSPIPSLLTGWDFALNPAQFGATQTITAGTPAYVWDQTICSSVVGNVAVARNSVTNAIQFTPSSANDALCMIQYLTLAEAKEMLFTRLSTNISAYLAAAAGVVTVRAYLFVGTSASTVPILPLMVGSLDALGNYTVTASGWTAIPRSGLDTPRAQLTANNPTVNNDIQFSGWEITQSAQFNDTNKFAMVITFGWTTVPVINVGSISLNKGDLPTRPAPLSFSDTLSKCQFYYEKSYNIGVLPGSISNAGQLFAIQGSAPTTDGTHTEVALRSFGITYKNTKRTAPTVTLYSPATLNASGKVSLTFSFDGAIKSGYPRDITVGAAAAGWTQTGNGNFATCYISNATDVVQNIGSVQDGTDETYINFHYVADSRLGVIA